MKPRNIKLGGKNIVGEKIVEYRKRNKIKQKDFMARLQVAGMDISPTSMSRLEGQHRSVYDFEVLVLAQVMCMTADDLLR